jgi:hypothetical protein
VALRWPFWILGEEISQVLGSGLFLQGFGLWPSLGMEPTAVGATVFQNLSCANLSLEWLTLRAGNTATTLGL